jgi:hypothetical protein
LTTAAPSSSIESAVAGFIVWLARQHAPVDDRRQCPNAIERFLRWQREQEQSHNEDTYYAYMRSCGANEFQISEARAAIGLFRSYLRARG